jgi:hypothetical protein
VVNAPIATPTAATIVMIVAPIGVAVNAIAAATDSHSIATKA